jgi:DNA-binding beta-propeller fold protein YncE
MKKILLALTLLLCTFLLFWQILSGQKPAGTPRSPAHAGFAGAGVVGDKQQIPLPSSKVLLEPVPGEVQRTNGFPGAMAVSPNKRYIAILNNGWGTRESDYSQSIAILDTQSSQATSFTLRDFPDARLKAKNSHQSYFYGVAFSSDGRAVYASIGSTGDPDGMRQGNTGNGIAVYKFDNGALTPDRFIKIATTPLPAGKSTRVSERQAPNRRVPYPAELAVVRNSKSAGDMLLVANNLSDEAVLLDPQNGNVFAHFELSLYSAIPGSFPYGVVVTKDGSTGYVSLWNASRVAELDLITGRVRRMIPLRQPRQDVQAGSHPTAMLLSPDEKQLYVALANTDEVAIVNRANPAATRYLSTRLPGQQFGGTYPVGLSLSSDGKLLFVAEASTDAVAVFDLSSTQSNAIGFIPAEWYPTAVRALGNDLFVLTGKSQGTGSNVAAAPQGSPALRNGHTYICALLYGSVARISLKDLRSHLREYTDEVLSSNLMRGNTRQIAFKAGKNPIRHVIYIIKENRTYDQILGDLGVGDSDSSLTMYGEEITPNQHKLARQFGVVDNFYDSGEVSGDGHVWSTAAITSDYTEKTWQINYRNSERSYDYEGEVMHMVPLDHGMPDVNEPGTGYLWTNFARHGISYRHYGEFVATIWCNFTPTQQSPTEGTPLEAGEDCPRGAVRKGEPLPNNLGQPHGTASVWPWDVPLPARNVPTKPELRGHFDPRYPDFRLEFPDQLRVDEFLNEFTQFVQSRKTGQGTQLPQFVLLRLGNDHTSAKQPLKPSPSAAIADNDLAVGRVVDAVSHSTYWDDTAIFILEDDAQDGYDHVDAHRSIAFVISKYSPRSDKPFIDHTFYTTVNMVGTIEALLGLPPMNNNDAHAAVMAPLFSGVGDQPPFSADARNLENGLIYQMNPPKGPDAKASAAMDFSHADAADAAELNAILWRDRMGSRPIPQQQHRVFAH